MGDFIFTFQWQHFMSSFRIWYPHFCRKFLHLFIAAAWCVWWLLGTLIIDYVVGEQFSLQFSCCFQSYYRKIDWNWKYVLNSCASSHTLESSLGCCVTGWGQPGWTWLCRPHQVRLLTCCAKGLMCWAPRCQRCPGGPLWSQGCFDSGWESGGTSGQTVLRRQWL